MPRLGGRATALLAGFLLAAGASVAALLSGSPTGALIGVGIAGLAGVLIVVQLLQSERRRHEVVEEELAGQASFLESLVAAFAEIASTLEVEEVLEVTRREAERLFGAQAVLLRPADEGYDATPDGVVVVPLRYRETEVARLRLGRPEPFGRDDRVRATVLGDFAARAIENARLLAEAQVREAERARLSDRLITAEQEERRRLALFLHDTSVQALSGITLMLDAAGDYIEQGRHDEAKRIVQSCLERQRDAIRGLRDLSFHLEPVVLRDQGFGPAVNELAAQLGIGEEIRIEVDVAPAEELATRAQAALYQIIREAFHGAIRRGPPTRMAVRVAEREDGSIETVIRDDAPGERRRATFEPIAERARTLNGELHVESGSDGGTTVRVTLPAYAAR